MRIVVVVVVVAVVVVVDFIAERYEMDEINSLTDRGLVVNIRITDGVQGFLSDSGVRNASRNVPIDIGITIPSTPKIAGNWARPRGLKLRWAGEPPAGYKPDGSIFIPVLRQVRYVRYRIGEGGSLFGIPVIITGKLPEIIGN